MPAIHTNATKFRSALAAGVFAIAAGMGTVQA
jgi:hypothetical protein